MKQLKVLAEFRDKNDFTLRHEAGDMLFIDDEKRVALLVQLGLCEVVGEVKRVGSGELRVESDVSDPAEEADNPADTSDTADTDAPAETEEQPKEPSEETAEQPSEETEAKPKAPRVKKSAAKETAKKPVTRKKSA